MLAQQVLEQAVHPRSALKEQQRLCFVVYARCESRAPGLQEYQTTA